MRLLFLSTVVLSCASTVHSQSLQIPPNSKLCDQIYAEVASNAESLNDIMSRCDHDTDAFALALHKFNRLPAPSNIKQLALRPRQGGEVPVFRVRYEADVFFNFLKAFPDHPVAFEKLGDIVDRINTGFEVVGIEIVSTSDPVERELEELKIATLRAEFLQRYFEAAGVRPDRIWTSSRAPSHSNTTEGRARDRSASITVNILREGSASK